MLVLGSLLGLGALAAAAAWLLTRNQEGDSMCERGRMAPEVARAFGRLEGILLTVDRRLIDLHRQGAKNMSIAQDLLAAVSGLVASVDVAINLLNQLAAGQAVSAADAQAAIDAINAEKAKVDAAVIADTPPAPGV